MSDKSHPVKWSKSGGEIAARAGRSSTLCDAQTAANDLPRRRSLRSHATLALLCAVTFGLTSIGCGLTSDDAIALGAAINAGDRKGVERLLDEGVDPDAHLAEGWRPLNLAAYHGESEIMQVLLAAGEPA